MRKKIIAFLLVFIFSFPLIGSIDSKKPQAISVGIGAGIGIVEIIKAIVLGTAVVGSGLVIGDLAINPEENADFTDFLKQVYNETVNLKNNSTPPPPKELTPFEQAALTSLLTQQGYEVGSDMYQKMYDYLQNTHTPVNIPTPDQINNTLNFNTASFQISGMVSGPYIERPTTITKIQKNFETIGYVKREFIRNLDPSWSSSFPTAINFTFIDINNKVYTYLQNDTYDSISIWNSNLVNGIFTGRLEGALTNRFISNLSIDLNNPFFPVESSIPENITIPETIVEPENFTPNFIGVDMSPLTGLVSTNQEMIDIISGNKVVSPQRYADITEAWNEVLANYLKNPNGTGLNTEPVAPTVDPTTGTIDYRDMPEGPITDPEAVPDELTGLQIVSYWLKGIWYGIRDLPYNIASAINKAFFWLKNFIDQFWINLTEVFTNFQMTFTTWWQDNFIYPWNTFQAWIQQQWIGIPELAQQIFDQIWLNPFNNLMQLIQTLIDGLPNLADLPDLLYNLIIPDSPSVGLVFEPVEQLLHDKIFVVLEPFKLVNFYEAEYQDIYANLQFGGISKNYKIIDYQYVKSVREDVKSLIRAFFWILILFFNLDQVHRLIRNQGIIKSYVRKMEDPKGDK